MSEQHESKDVLPRPVRLALGATSPGVGDHRLRGAVEGKIVLITGASSGVGRAAALRLGRAGAKVLLVARREELLEELGEEIEAAGGSAVAHPCNMADPDRVGELCDEVLDRHGHVDVVVSNAGLSIRRWLSQSYDRFHDFERTINVNYLGPVRLLLGLIPSMRERGSGHIVNVATVGVNYPPMRWSAYIASKQAFETWLRGVAPEIRADGVSTTSIHMQLVRSPMLGPFRIWRYVPGMSTEEAAGIVARAIVEKPRVIAPQWARLGAAFSDVFQEPVEALLSRQARAVNPESRERSPRPPWDPVRLVAGAVGLASQAAGSASTVASVGVVRPVRPDRLARVALAQLRYGTTPAFAAASGAALYGSRPAVIDELGSLTFDELDAAVRALAGALHERFELGPDRRVAIMCRNHRGFVHALVAASRLGCDVVALNTDFAAPQLADVLAREGVSVAVHDEEFDEVFTTAGFEGPRVLAWHGDDQPGKPGLPTLASLIAQGAPEAPAPEAHGRVIVLTSGTTGTPKGAVRTLKLGALPSMAFGGFLELSRLRPAPRSGEPLLVAPPLFHLYGQVGLLAAFALGSPAVIRRRFDAEETLADIERHDVGTLLAVPTMLGRIMDMPEQTRSSYDTSSLRVVFSGAAPLPPELATAFMDEFGDILYNGYASTEVGSGTLATPRDLRRAPGTVGKPMAGTTVRILGEDGGELAAGTTGRIFVRGPLLFDGYTGGGETKEVIDGFMSTGDVGHFDAAGRLFIDGRDDEMIVSGGENVYPQEVEDLLVGHDAVADAGVFAVADRDFGQRLEAFVVLRPDASATADELRGHVRSHLARFKVPREITFVDELPRTSTGKLQRRKLPELAEAER